MNTKYFKFSEMWNSTTASQQGIDNEPRDAGVISNLTYVQQSIDKIREVFGKPIYVTSGYRCPALNKAVGGAKNSQHLTGEAVDLRCSDNVKLMELIKSKFEYDQLINEKPNANDGEPTWVHFSVKREKNRRQFLVIK